MTAAVILCVHGRHVLAPSALVSNTKAEGVCLSFSYGSPLTLRGMFFPPVSKVTRQMVLLPNS